jgi:serine-type D-Ala-D-Ala carboxypeptidase/endopeptidase
VNDTAQRIVQRALDEARQTQFIPGGVVGIVMPDRGDVGLSSTAVVPFGVADVRIGNPVDASTSFEIGSLTKVFTASILATAMSDAALGVHLDSPLQDVAPITVPRLGPAPMTLGHLVTHRSGLPRMPGHGVAGPVDRARLRPEELWAAVAGCRLLFPPGSSWLYSNFGFGVLGTVLCQLTGRSFVDLVDEIVCQPLGLTGTALEHVPEPPDEGRTRWWRRTPVTSGAETNAVNVATGYRKGSTPGSPIIGPRWNNTGAMAGSGGLVSTGADMTRFLTAAAGYATGPVAASLARTRQTIPATGPDSKPMGMAWQIRSTTGSPPFLFKNGGTSGMHCAMAVLPPASGPSGGTGVVVLTNGPDHVDGLVVGLLAALSAAH